MFVISVGTCACSHRQFEGLDLVTYNLILFTEDVLEFKLKNSIVCNTSNIGNRTWSSLYNKIAFQLMPNLLQKNVMLNCGIKKGKVNFV